MKTEIFFTVVVLEALLGFSFAYHVGESFSLKESGDRKGNDVDNRGDDEEPIFQPLPEIANLKSNDVDNSDDDEEPIFPPLSESGNRKISDVDNGDNDDEEPIFPPLPEIAKLKSNDVDNSDDDVEPIFPPLSQSGNRKNNDVDNSDDDEEPIFPPISKNNNDEFLVMDAKYIRREELLPLDRQYGCPPYYNNWSCCSYSSPCGSGQGDCDSDWDCSGSLVCGSNNCIGGASGLDCCTSSSSSYCYPYYNHWSCCSFSSPCGYGHGDCDSDYDCVGNLVCGSNNCVGGASSLDCCTSSGTSSPSSSCSPNNNNWSCCTFSSPCGSGQGDCDCDSDCAGSLVCGSNNCVGGASSLDCCTSPSSPPSSPIGLCDKNNYDWSCCTTSSPCGYGEGDCDSDWDCSGSLVCGQDNCFGPGTYMDCCTSGGSMGGSCNGRCGRSSSGCSCSSICLINGNCCHDYDQFCVTDCVLAWKSDGDCDDVNNNENCQWDGGDCCNYYGITNRKYCDACACLDPTFYGCINSDIDEECEDLAIAGLCQEFNIDGGNYGETHCRKSCNACYKNVFYGRNVVDYTMNGTKEETMKMTMAEERAPRNYKNKNPKRWCSRYRFKCYDTRRIPGTQIEWGDYLYVASTCQTCDTNPNAAVCKTRTTPKCCNRCDFHPHTTSNCHNHLLGRFCQRVTTKLLSVCTNGRGCRYTSRASCKKYITRNCAQSCSVCG